MILTIEAICNDKESPYAPETGDSHDLPTLFEGKTVVLARIGCV